MLGKGLESKVRVGVEVRDRHWLSGGTSTPPQFGLLGASLLVTGFTANELDQ